MKMVDGLHIVLTLNTLVFNQVFVNLLSGEPIKYGLILFKAVSVFLNVSLTPV